MKAKRLVIDSNGVPYLQMRSVDRTPRQKWKRKEGRKGRGPLITNNELQTLYYQTSNS